MDHATVVVSGTKIAAEIGTTRSEVWRLVQQLRTLGVEIAGHPATGYRLRSIPDLLLPEMLAPLLKGTIFSHIHHYYTIGSTNTQAMEAAAAGASEGSVFLAEEQTAGRGRGGHTWHAAWSVGRHCSGILRPALHKLGARDSILRRFQERSSSARGQVVSVEENGGFEGTTAGLDARGFLQVRTGTGVRTVLSGTVRLI